jgi:hypothetical protein
MTGKTNKEFLFDAVDEIARSKWITKEQVEAALAVTLTPVPETQDQTVQAMALKYRTYYECEPAGHHFLNWVSAHAPKAGAKFGGYVTLSVLTGLQLTMDDVRTR